jgi:hypothetical protein
VTIDDTAMSSADIADVTAMKTRRNDAPAHPLPRSATAAFGSTRPADTSASDIRTGKPMDILVSVCFKNVEEHEQGKPTAAQVAGYLGITVLLLRVRNASDAVTSYILEARPKLIPKFKGGSLTREHRGQL